MKAKTIEALDGVISALEELKEALEAEASKSGDDADAENTGKVAGRKGKTGSGAVSSSGKGKTRGKAATSDDDDADGNAAGDDDDNDSGDAGDDDDSPPPKPKGLKDKAGKAAAGKPAAKTTGKAKPKVVKEPDEFDADAVRDLLNTIITEFEGGRDEALKILKKFDAQKVAELDKDADTYESVWRAAFKRYKVLKAAAAEDTSDDE